MLSMSVIFVGQSIKAPFVHRQTFLEQIDNPLFLDLISFSAKYNQIIFEQLVKQRYLLTKFANTSYDEAGNIPPTERILLLKFIEEDLQNQQKMRDEMQAKLQSR